MAPKFDGKPASLALFLDEIEQLADACGLTPKQTIDWTVRYAPNEEYELWEMQTSVGSSNWSQFKKELCDLYPGSTGERKYSIANLKALTEKQANSDIHNAEDFGTYKRAFLTISAFLKKKDRLSDREISVYFIEGMNSAFRSKVQGQLRAENPLHHTDDPYSLEKISSAALFVLSCSDNVVKEKSPTSSIKKAHFDASNLIGSNNDMSTLVAEVIRQLNLQTVTNGNQGAFSNNTQRSRACNFCSDPNHFLKGRTGRMDGCKLATEYLQKGLCKTSDSGFITLPNGDRINAPGKDIKERINNWLKVNNATVPPVSTTFVSTANVGPAARFVWLKEEEDLEVATEREVEELRVLESLVASTQKKIEETKKKVGGATKGKTVNRGRDNLGNNNQPANKPAEQSRNEPQFKYQTPIEDPSLVKTVAKQALDAAVTMTTRELLSISPDVRRHVKDLLTAKRVPQTATTAFYEEEEGIGPAEVFMSELTSHNDNLIVAKEVEELRALDVHIEGNKVEALADDGSQIISIRRDVWERFGSPIRSDHVMVMESANLSKNETMGLLQNLKIVIGGYEFYVQAQVVQNAPYELLLGRPFFTLTQATHRHFSNGSSHLTLVDPNTQAVITIPTHARKRESVQTAYQAGF